MADSGWPASAVGRGGWATPCSRCVRGSCGQRPAQRGTRYQLGSPTFALHWVISDGGVATWS